MRSAGSVSASRILSSFSLPSFMDRRRGCNQHWRIQGGAGGHAPVIIVRLRVLEYLNIQMSTEYLILGIGAANRRLITELKCIQGCLFVKLLRLQLKPSLRYKKACSDWGGGGESMDIW